MYYTLEDFLKDHASMGIRRLTGPADFAGVQVQSVSVQELPLDNFIGKDELVLSTAIGCCQDVPLFKKLIADVKASQAAAMFLAFKDPAYTVPPEVAAYADEQGLPLFVIPWEYRFAEIQSCVIQKIQSKKLEVYQNLQTALLNAYFDSQPLSRAAELISGLLGVPVAVEDSGHRVRGSTGDFPAEDGAQVQKVEIQINHVLSGYLCVMAPAPDALPEAYLLEKYILFPLSLWFNRKSIEDMMETRLKNDFVWNLATENYASFDEIARQGMQLHFDLTRPYTCIMLKAVSAGAAASVREYSGEAASAASKIEAVVLEQGKRQALRVMIADRSLQFIMYVENPGTSPLAAVHRFLESVRQRLQSELPSYEFFWGVSETSLKPPDFSRLYHNAALALQYCMNSETKEYQFTYQDTQKARILSVLSTDDEIAAMARETLGGLREYDAGSGINLMGTLAKFIDCNYNVSLTARELHIHRQSLLYRLEKIETLTEMSLSSHKDLFLLEVFSRIFSDY